MLEMHHQTHDHLEKIPYLNAIKSLKKEHFHDVPVKSMTECVICMENFKDNDNVAELNCDLRHYFHEKCIEEWLKTKLSCPLCKREVKVGRKPSDVNSE